MYNNIGERIKSLAKLITTLLIVLFSVFGLYIMLDNVIIGIIVIAVGVFVAWLSTLLVYSWGQLVANSDMLVNIVDSLEEELNKVNDKLSVIENNQSELKSLVNSIDGEPQNTTTSHSTNSNIMND